ncbi:hypothetical protein Csa_006498 [Cucumis sativus]|uniref:Uncharacterized protein n=1 Tax=Cucumis sativus TaxID=3659 RepID=A0A0A0LJ05_CUCSA|nr:hypothetical protein Csa_006498 [Cucumis sativus]
MYNILFKGKWVINKVQDWRGGPGRTSHGCRSVGPQRGSEHDYLCFDATFVLKAYTGPSLSYLCLATPAVPANNQKPFLCEVQNTTTLFLFCFIPKLKLYSH